MRKWWERALANFVDAGTLFGMPPASIELMVLNERERQQLELDRARQATSMDDDDDEGDGGSRVEPEPIAA